MPNRDYQHGLNGLLRPWVTSQAVFDQETEKIFDSCWIHVGRVQQLHSGSGVCPIKYENQRLLLVLDQKGQVRAFRNFCRHRGSQLVTERNCRQIGERLQCPYHAWTYDRHGQLVSAPHMDGVHGFQLSDYGLIEVPCQTRGGSVWINFQPHQPLQDFLAPLASQFRDWSLDDLRVAAEISYTVRANWKLIFQNFNECYHCPMVHPLLNRLTPFRDAENELVAGPILGGPMKLSQDTETLSTDGRLVARPLPRLTDVQSRSVSYFTIFPTMFFSPHPDYVLIHRLERMAVDQTRVLCQWLFEPTEATEASGDLKRAVEFWDLTNRQDWEVCELAQLGMEDVAYIPGPYSSLESIVRAFDEHYLSIMDSD